MQQNRPPRYELERCSLRRIDAPSARRCLAGRSVVMVGQSWTRYAYLSLVHLIELGAVPGASKVNSVCWEKSWAVHWNDTRFRGEQLDGYGRQWTNFFNGTNALFASAGGRELCDCSRRSMKEPHQENRFYESRAFYAGAPTRVSYFQGVGGLRIDGHAHPKVGGGAMGALADQLDWCKPGLCTLARKGGDNRTDLSAEPPPHWSFRPHELMADVVTPLRPDALLWSSDTGNWPSCDSDHRSSDGIPNGRLSATLQNGMRALAPGGLAFHKSRTPERTINRVPDNNTRCFDALCGGHAQDGTKCFRERMTQRHHWRLLDHFEMIASLYRQHQATWAQRAWVDRAHHECWVTNELVNLWLNMLCTERGFATERKARGKPA